MTVYTPFEAAVEWVDSSLQNIQVSASDFPVPCVIRSVGWMLADSPSHITLARDDMNDGDYRGLLAIPRECIRSVTVLSRAPDSSTVGAPPGPAAVPPEAT